MKTFAVCAILLALGASFYFMTATSDGSAVEQQYQLYLAEYGKSIANGDEYQMRLRIFEQNLKKIEQINAEQDSYRVAVNKFADMTDAEYKKMLGYVQIKNRMPAQEFTGAADDSKDWRKDGAVNGVQDQGQCGSCWAFSATAAFEGAYFQKTGKLVKFSEQQLVDCSGSFGNEGCNGGLMDSAFQYLEQTPFCTAKDYKYTARDGKCKASSCGVPDAKTTGHTDVPAKSAQALKNALSQRVVSVAIEADQSSFQFYSGGILSSGCGINLDHGVTAVGYGTENGKDYWIVRNSWGAGWGESGYIRIGTGNESKGGVCGILLDASYPQL
jgi:C1A family cysteine protease